MARRKKHPGVFELEKKYDSTTVYVARCFDAREKGPGSAREKRTTRRRGGSEARRRRVDVPLR